MESEWVNESIKYESMVHKHSTLPCLVLVWFGLDCLAIGYAYNSVYVFCCINTYRCYRKLQLLLLLLVFIRLKYSFCAVQRRMQPTRKTHYFTSEQVRRTELANARAYRTNSLTTNLLHWIAGKHELCAGGTSETVWCFSFSILFCFTTQMERILNSVPMNFLSFSYEGAVHQTCLYVPF